MPHGRPPSRLRQGRDPARGARHRVTTLTYESERDLQAPEPDPSQTPKRFENDPHGYHGEGSIGGEPVIWLLVLLLLLLALGGGVFVSKFLFFLLIVVLVLALVGAFNRSTY